MFITQSWLVGRYAAVAAIAVALVHAQPVCAQADLRIGLSVEPTSLDPHFHNLTPNSQVTAHMFEALIETAPNFSVRPGLAKSYRVINPTTWEFKLRKGVRFHDGKPLSANDVVFSLCRVSKVVGSPSPLTVYTKAIQEIETPDPYTLIIKTKGPFPLLAQDLSRIGIISDHLIGGEKVKYNHDGCNINGTWPATEDFNKGKNAIGTGPYKYAEFVKGDHVLFKRNDSYWGDKPQWATVLMRPIGNSAARVSALMDGNVDFIENPPIKDLIRLMSGNKFKIVGNVSARMLYIMPDERSDAAPIDVKGTNGKNPFRDVRVRQALSMAIDRQSIIEHVMAGFAKPANQLLDREFFGANKLMPKIAYNPEEAKKLLAQAGYPNGFEITLATPNDRYVNDAQVAQAVAQMWSSIGVKTHVNAMPSNVFFAKRSKHEFGIWLAGWLASTGEMSSPLRALVASVNVDKGWGVSNLAGISNPELDALIDEAMNTVDDNKRQLLLAMASKKSMELMPVIPLHAEITPWAMRADLEYRARADQSTYAFDVKHSN